jgi:hypothetical protein
VNSAVPKCSSSKTFPIPPGGRQVRVRSRYRRQSIEPNTGRYAIKRSALTPGADAAGVIDQVARVSDGGMAIASSAARGKARAHTRSSSCACPIGCIGCRIAFRSARRQLFVPYVTAWRSSVAPTPRRRHGVDPWRKRRRRRGGDAVRGRGRRAVIGTAGTDEGVAVVEGARREHRQPQGARLPRQIVRFGGAARRDSRDARQRQLDHDLTIVAPSGRIVVIGNRGRVEIDAQIMTEGRAGVRLALGHPPDEIRRATRRSSRDWNPLNRGGNRAAVEGCRAGHHG